MKICKDDYWKGKVELLKMDHFLEKKSHNNCNGANNEMMWLVVLHR